MSAITMAKHGKGGLLASLIQKFRPLVIGNYHLTETNNFAPKQTIEEAIGLPPKPKKPLTPYFRFMAANRDLLRIKDSKLSIRDEVKRLSKEWHSVDQNTKQRLQDEYQKDLKIYVEQRANYDSKLTDEDRKLIKEMKQERTEAKNKRMMRKRLKELGRPKRPPTAFLAFIIQERKNTPLAPSQTYRQWHQKCTNKWQSMSENEKNIYFKESRKNLDKYKQDMDVWENKMIKLGHVDVVRSHVLIDNNNTSQKKK